MELHVRKSPGLRNDLLLVMERAEIEETLLHIANRAGLMDLPGLTRHLPYQDSQQRARVNALKIPVEEHLREMRVEGEPLVGPEGRPRRRVIVIGCRNLGNNHGAVAWQAEGDPKLFHVQGDPLSLPSYPCLVSARDRQLSIRDLRFESDRVLERHADVSALVSWCAFGSPVLRDGAVVSIEDVLEQFTDVRQVLAFVRELPLGQKIEAEVLQGYPEAFRDNVLRVLRAGVPRQRFLHNAVGLSRDKVFVLQREGTPEEVGHCLRKAEATDGLILDNGGSVFCWAWWPHQAGGFLFSAPDFRPRGSAIVAFVLKGPASTDLPGGSASFTVV